MLIEFLDVDSTMTHSLWLSIILHETRNSHYEGYLFDSVKCCRGGELTCSEPPLIPDFEQCNKNFCLFLASHDKIAFYSGPSRKKKCNCRHNGRCFLTFIHMKIYHRIPPYTKNRRKTSYFSENEDQHASSTRILISHNQNNFINLSSVVMRRWLKITA